MRLQCTQQRAHRIGHQQIVVIKKLDVFTPRLADPSRQVARLQQGYRIVEIADRKTALGTIVLHDAGDGIASTVIAHDDFDGIVLLEHGAHQRLFKELRLVGRNHNTDQYRVAHRKS
ncbi:hypothetical protein D3C81_1784040 [compost metagenome]